MCGVIKLPNQVSSSVGRLKSGDAALRVGRRCGNGCHKSILGRPQYVIDAHV